MLVSDKILAANRGGLDQMLTHRFIKEIRADKLEREFFHRYLAYEGPFVTTAISIFAHGVTKAPDIATQRWLIGVLDALANTQVPYFEEITARRGIAPVLALPEAVTAFDTGMLEIARTGSFAEMLTAMFAAEWMYWTWCKEASTHHISDPDLRAWIDMHADDAFAEQALWLKSAIDTYSDDSQTEHLSAIFGRVTALEYAFHSAPYEDFSSAQGSSA
jgi:thiaminase/transcriptional activator TenA